MKKNLKVLQDGYKECGACCLLSILRYYEGNISINNLLELTKTNKDGTNFYNIKEASIKLGLDAIGFKINKKDNFSELKEINGPSIWQIIEQHYEHFVVVYNIRGNKILIMDPAKGFNTLSWEEFLEKITGYFMVFSKRKKLINIHPSKYLNKIIVDTLYKNKSIVSNIVILSLVFTILSCVQAMYSGIIIDNVIGTTKNNLLIVTLIFAFSGFLKSFVSLFRNELLIYLNQKLDCSIFLGTFQKILLLPYSYYKNRTTGEVVARINDLTYIKNVLNRVILAVFLDMFISLGCAILLFFVNKILFLLAIITIMIYIVIFLGFRPIIKKYIDINQENNAQIHSLMIESIQGFETVKNLHMEKKMINKMSSLYSKSLNDIFCYDNFNNSELFMKDVIISVGILLIELIGFTFVFDGILTVGQVVMFITLLSYFIEPIKNIIDLNTEYCYAMNALKRANNLFDIDSVDMKTKTNFNILGNININHLSYSYNDYNDILNDINLDIKAGEKVLILGNSGSGKSTFLKILEKYYEPKRDMVYLDGIDINDISICNVKNDIVSISQGEIVFADTIKNNILLDREIEDKMFMDICKMVYIDKIVKNMFLGYDTVLEENGQNISGGQRQRVILARALLKKFHIMLIDEGLNAIDVDLERKILKNIFSSYRDKTFIIVSHRKENMDLYDKIIKLENGIVKDIVTYPKECL